MKPESGFTEQDPSREPPRPMWNPPGDGVWLEEMEAGGWTDGVKQPADSALPGPLFAWQDEYSVGIGVLDEQHRQIFQLLNRLHEAVLLHPGKLTTNLLLPPEQGRAALGSLLDELLAYVRWHFAAEELLMQAFDFPEALAHELEHERQLRVLLAFREQFADDGEQLVTPLLEYMASWFIRHILTTDRHYSAFFAEHGARP